MKNSLKNLWLFISLVIVFAACSKPAEEKEEVVEISEPGLSQQQLDSLNWVYIAVNDSLDASWIVMIKDDDEKIADMKRLLNEISKTKRYDKARHRELINDVDKLALIRYDRKSMADSDKIDEYDSANSIMTKEVILFAANHPQYEDNPVFEDIINEIQVADNRVILHRIRYDRSAKAFNSFVQQNQPYINQLNTSRKDWSKVALFELSE
ncbi:hypothetical protein BH23BAC1_BH23BAC1_36310 [soil metagenome]|jgi:hypothetical protein